MLGVLSRHDYVLARRGWSEGVWIQLCGGLKRAWPCLGGSEGMWPSSRYMVGVWALKVNMRSGNWLGKSQPSGPSGFCQHHCCLGRGTGWADCDSLSHSPVWMLEISEPQFLLFSPTLSTAPRNHAEIRKIISQGCFEVLLGFWSSEKPNIKTLTPVSLLCFSEPELFGPSYLINVTTSETQARLCTHSYCLYLNTHFQI